MIDMQNAKTLSVTPSEPEKMIARDFPHHCRLLMGICRRWSVDRNSRVAKTTEQF